MRLVVLLSVCLALAAASPQQGLLVRRSTSDTGSAPRGLTGPGVCEGVLHIRHCAKLWILQL